ncbi:hypothetical protein N0B44_33695 [Roseibacterium beibuensis]|uniref:Uncharacterized protein n=1 Tax=[Roseibacterium] beibuensis TaxID=1193142 RepID=A0ABP9LDG9_9RHOB|nr:hypothetical protein [Roseibacterium beibuensis]MCS6627866.1 hypothetical protein [Roseibacterium beibuensis]
MTRRFSLGLLAAICVGMMSVAALPVAAQQFLGQYTAYIGQQDLYNSNGQRLTEHWQILRQDRANLHRFGISQPGDEWDPWFGNYNARGAMEQMIMQGAADPVARQNIIAGGATVVVQVYGWNGQPSRIDVQVWR